MSARLVSMVLESDLPAWLKPYAAALATFAASDGSRVYPAVARLARMVGRSERSTQTAIHELRRRGVLEVLAPARQHHSTHYRFVDDALPFSDGDQLRLFPQGFAQPRAEKTGQLEDFRSHQQAGVKWASPRGEVGFTRSVIDPSRTSTHQRARARKGIYPKTGTD